MTSSINSITAMKKKLAAFNTQQPKTSAPPSPSKHSEKVRKEKLKAIQKDLNAGKHVQNRTLKTWLNEDEYDELEQTWDEQKDIRNTLMDKPDAVKEYERLLKKGLFAENKSTGFGGKNRKASNQTSNEADALFERALEYLDEQIQADPSLEQWFDRTLDFSAGGNISISGAGMPRAVTSRSLDNAGGGLNMAKQSKTEVKIDVVERALDKL